MFGGHFANFGEIAVAAGCLCGYPCWMSYLDKAIVNTNKKNKA
jgi:hypothetical protein